MTRPLHRRTFLSAASAAVAAGVHKAATAGGVAKARIKFALVGINHEHVFRLVNAVRGGGGDLVMVYANDPDPNHAAKFFRDNPNVTRAREEREVLEADGIDLVISAAPPAERAALGVRVMKAGKDFLADKGGFLTLNSLAEARRVQAETKRTYAVCYNERVLDPATVRAAELVSVGAIGKVTHTLGTGPHGLFGHGPREDWFWTREGRGGILTDIGTHQADQFLYFTGSTTAEIVAARTGNFRTPQHAEFEDFGEVMWKGDGGVGWARVDFYEGHSLGIRLTVLGTEGSMEVFKNAGRILLTDRKERREIKVAPDFICPFGRQLVDDVLHRTETAMSQSHAFLASELAVRSQMKAAEGADG